MKPIWLACSCVLLFFVGCSRAPEPTFVVSAEVEALSELHQQNIQDSLRLIFGTPGNPRADLIEETEAEEDEVDEDEAGDEDAAAEVQSATATTAILDADVLRRGALVYRNRCSGCHGVSGDGQGPAAEYLQPKPRDYRKAVYKFTSTPYGRLPVRQDLIRTVRRGAKGTSMPAFPWMSNEDVEAVVDYVIYFSLRGRVESMVAEYSEDYDEDEPIEFVDFTDSLLSEHERWQEAEEQIVNAISAEPAYDEASVKLGRELFIKSSCYSCHGVDAEGQTEWLSPEFIAAQEAAPDGQRIEINYDAWGDPAPAADITARMLHGGRRPIDIYRRIYTGINGTPMPAFGDIFTENPDAIWHLVHYVEHIVDGGEPNLGIDVTNEEEPADETS